MAIRTKYGQLQAGVVTTLSIPVRACRYIELLLRYEQDGDSTMPIYFTVDDTNPDTPTVEGDNTEYVAVGLGIRRPAPLNAETVVIKMISAGTSKYAVRVW